MRILFAVLAFLLLPFGAFASGETVDIGGLRVTVWKPKGSDPAPIVVFSHGFHGCSTQSSFLMEALAEDGYIVFAPNHKDATCNSGAANWLSRSEKSFRKPEEWDDKTFIDRRDDIFGLVKNLRSDSRYKDRIDWSRFAITGHSLGGYVALAIGGGYESWTLKGVKAIIAMSPYNQPFKTLEHLEAPVMYQGGMHDPGITPSVKKNHGAYVMSPSPKYFVNFEEANHFAWTDMNPLAHEQIVAYTLVFLDHYLRGQPGEQLTKPMKGVAELEYDSELGSK